MSFAKCNLLSVCFVVPPQVHKFYSADVASFPTCEIKACPAFTRIRWPAEKSRRALASTRRPASSSRGQESESLDQHYEKYNELAKSCLFVRRRSFLLPRSCSSLGLLEYRQRSLWRKRQPRSVCSFGMSCTLLMATGTVITATCHFLIRTPRATSDATSRPTPVADCRGMQFVHIYNRPVIRLMSRHQRPRL